MLCGGSDLRFRESPFSLLCSSGDLWRRYVGSVEGRAQLGLSTALVTACGFRGGAWWRRVEG